MMKKIISALLAVLLLAGCSGAKSEEQPTQQTTLAPTTEAQITGNVVDGALLNFFYMDAIQQQYSTWSQTFGESINDYLQMYFGLDVTKPLDLQIYDQTTGITWADHFVQLAKVDATATLAIYEHAAAQGHPLSDDAKSEYDEWISTYESYAEMYAITPDEFIAANYGENATFEMWKEYLLKVITAQDFAMIYADSLSFDQTALREAEEGREAEFSSYSFAVYHLSYQKYPHLGLTTVDGNVTYDDAQKAAALDAAKADAETLTKATTVEKFNELIKELPCNSGSAEVACTVSENTAYSELNEIIRPWLTDPNRKAGECTVIANETTVQNEDGTETTVRNGYYAVLFTGVNDNKQPLANVRYLLVLADEEKDAEAKQKADDLLAQWQKTPTEENFIALVKEHSDDASAESGGLFEDVAPNSPYMPEFLNWAIDPQRKAGDCEIVKTQYGYHIIYYVGNSETTYRDLLISTELEDAAYTAWYEGIVGSYEVTFINEEAVNYGYIFTPAS